MIVLVTGAAGFIGSHLCEQLLVHGHRVVGLDSFTDFYPRFLKEKNLETCRKHPLFQLLEGDIIAALPRLHLDEIEVVYHLAAQAGVRSSWGSSFEIYTNLNVLTTQHLLEAFVGRSLKRFIYASSSSVYGSTSDLPLNETSLPQPYSPYGVTKLAAEHLMQLYWRNFSIPAVSLRYFTVFGPRQRPDMAFHRFFKAAMTGGPITVYGDGDQTRDFTYVGDIVAANIAAIEAPTGSIMNIGGGSRIGLRETLRIIESIVGHSLKLVFQEQQKGDMRHTSADMSRAKSLINYDPRVTLPEGLAHQYEWMLRHRDLIVG